jgi:ATP-dependent Clp protease ATP-binding subunit ClpC
MNTVFERFTDRSRRVLVLAQQEARLLDHDFIGTEHILLGLIDEEEGVAAKALKSMGVEKEVVRTRVEQTVPRAESRLSEPPPFTPRAKKVLELALREALQLGHKYIGTEHLLLGVLREGEGVACQVLVNLGADPSLVRQTVIQLLSGYAPEMVVEEIGVAGTPRCQRCGNSLSEHLTYSVLSADPVSDTEDPARQPRSVVIVFCRNCGRPVGVFAEAEEP